jgi:hypothetical protein
MTGSDGWLARCRPEQECVMSTPKPTDTVPKPKPSDTGKTDKTCKTDLGRQAQIDDAKDEGAGKASVPIEDMTTENDE